MEHLEKELVVAVDVVAHQVRGGAHEQDVVAEGRV